MNTLNKSRQYIVVFVITAAAIVTYLLCHKVDMKQPIAFAQDKAVDLFIKSVVEESNDLQEDILFACEYNVQNIVILLLAKIWGNVWMGINCYYIMTFFLISFSMYHFTLKLRISNSIAIGLAVLTAFLPFHVDRGEGQMITSNFFMVPLFLEMFYELIYCMKTDVHKKNYFILVSLAAFIDLRLSIMVCIIFAILLLQRFDKEVAFRAVRYYIPLILFSIIVGIISPTLKTIDLETAKEEGLRILDLIEPMRYHVLDKLSNIRLDYDISFSAHGESGLNSMGLFFSIGFICMLLGLFLEWKNDRRIAWMGMLSLFVVVIAGVYGIGLVVDYFGIHVVYWNRMAIFIIVCSVATLGILFDNITQSFKKKFGKKGVLIGCIAINMIYILSFLELILRQNI